MSKDLPPDDDTLSLAAKERIDKTCLAFEDAWKAGGRPRIEQYLGDSPESERSALLRELLLLESYYRCQGGESLSPEEYQARFPDHPQVVAAVLRPMARCPSCSTEVPGAIHLCPRCGASIPTPGATPAGPSETLTLSMPADARPSPASSERLSPQSSSQHGRFLPGTVLADRYRIVALLGRGGMGEVYRADDLKLGQPVALKFLPERLARDPDLLAFFYNEVRLTRQISHPNVCRVHDIGEVDGQHFLSMEYVDGEDLAGLLRRIGRLPPDKGTTIARQLSAGLAAAHQKGILHRDLKPANVMLDGRGQVRITDFGLACPSDLPEDEQLRAGTPFYMAPEQAAGHPATVRSDIYSLGLVLYEVFTGKPAFQADSGSELARIRRQSSPISPSMIVEDLDPAIERIILHCLARDPKDRPSSALAVLAALPGQDPLGAALAAGETPSPEMVAAAGEAGGLHPGIGAACLAGVLLGLVGVVLLSERTTLIGQVDLQKPGALESRATEIIGRLGHEKPPKDRAYGFAYSESQRYGGVSDPHGTPIYFWYRQSPSPLVPELFAGSFAAKGNGTVSLVDPPPPVPGEISARLDPRGRLIELRAAPLTSEGDRPQAAAPGDPAADARLLRQYVLLFQRAGLIGEEDKALDPKGFRPLPATSTPPVCSDTRRAWEGEDPKTGLPLRVEAAALGEVPVYFRVAPSRSEGPGRPGFAGWLATGGLVAVVAFFLMVVLAAVLVRRNLRAGRGDRRGALRLALFLFAVSVLAWLLRTSRGAMIPRWSVFIMGVEYALFWSLAVWLFFIALEPYVRRLWPQTLISWNRLFGGRFRDPRVGRDLLVGVLFGVGTRVLWQINVLAPSWCNLEPAEPLGPGQRAFDVLLGPLLGGRYCAGELFQGLASAIRWGLFAMILLLLLRLILRRQWPAVGVYVLLSTAIWSAGVGHPYFSWPIGALISAVFVILLMRFGLVTVVSYTFVRLLLTFPITSDLLAWHATSTTLFPLGVIFALAVYGFYVSLAGQPLLGEAILRN